MKKLTLLTFAILNSQCIAQGNWQISKQNVLPVSKQAIYSHFVFKQKNTQQKVDIHAVLLKQGQYQAQLVDQKPWFRFLSFERVFQTTKRHGAFAGINGGYFTPENSPLGLMVLKGKKTADFSYSKLLSGLVIINQSGKLSFRTSRQGYHQAYYALQAGPFLIQHGKIEVKAGGKAYRRTVLAKDKQGDLLLVSSNKVSLHTLALILKSFANQFGLQQTTTALNLDGGSSTAMTVLLPKHKPVVIPEVLPVRNALLFYLKK